MTQDQLDNLCNLHATLYVYQERIDRLLRDLGDVLRSAGVHNVPDVSGTTTRRRPRST